MYNTVSRTIRSRIDYIWTRGFPPDALLGIHIDDKLQRLHSHHRLLWLEVHSAVTDQGAADGASVHRLRIPNLRAASQEQQQAFVDHLEQHLLLHQHDLTLMLHSTDASSLNELAVTLTSLARSSAFKTLPVTGSSPYQSKQMLSTERRRRALTRLLRTSEALRATGTASFTRSPEWLHLYQRCVRDHNVHWFINLFQQHDVDGWLRETRQLIRHTRASMRQQCKVMRVDKQASFDANPAAAIHRMLASNTLPSQIHSVVDSHGHLTSTPAELKEVMAMHFESVFSIPPPDPCPSLSDASPPSMLFDKPHIDSSWYDPLMQPITGDELLAVLSDTALQTSPGEDQVSSGVWKLAIQGSPCARRWVSSLFTACLQSSYFPAAWKSSIIHPLIKDALKERSMSNIRPISLQSCLGKLFNKVLAYRLAKILSLHPILHPSQRGFVLGGSITKCIDELLDVWDWSRCSRPKHELYTLFYDIKQAYDSVQVEVLVRALHRIHLPAAFVALIAHSLTGLTSCVRTVYGPSRSIAVERSMRQGDPLAPLLFVILMDALHEGLDTNPFTGRQHGLQLMSTYLPSLGYADDTTVLTSSLPDLRIQNDWVAYFMRFNSLRLNPAKCELVGRNGAGEPVSDLDIAAHGIDGGGSASEACASRTRHPLPGCACALRW